MCHVTRVNESCHTCDMSHVTRMNESCQPYGANSDFARLPRMHMFPQFLGLFGTHRSILIVLFGKRYYVTHILPKSPMRIALPKSPMKIELRIGSLNF